MKLQREENKNEAGKIKNKNGKRARTNSALEKRQRKESCWVTAPGHTWVTPGHTWPHLGDTLDSQRVLLRSRLHVWIKLWHKLMLPSQKTPPLERSRSRSCMTRARNIFEDYSWPLLIANYTNKRTLAHVVTLTLTYKASLLTGLVNFYCSLCASIFS